MDDVEVYGVPEMAHETPTSPNGIHGPAQISATAIKTTLLACSEYLCDKLPLTNLSC